MQAVAQKASGSALAVHNDSSATSTAHFGSATTPGNMLVAVCSVALWNTVAEGTLPDPTINAPVTAGLTWLPAVMSSASPSYLYQAIPNNYIRNKTAIFYCANAPAIGSGVNTTCQSTTSSPTATNITQVALFELSDVTTLDAVSSAADENATVTVPPLATTGTDIILAAITNIDVPNESAGLGWTFDYTITYGEDAYILNNPSGSRSVNAWSSITPNSPNVTGVWSVVAAAFGSTPPTPILQVSPVSLNFSAVQNGPNPASQSTLVTNSDGGTLNWTTTSDQAWMSAAPSGTGNTTLAINVSIAGLSPGLYTGHLTIAAAGATGSPQTVTVTLTILGAASGGGGDGITSCIPSYANGVFIGDCSLYIEPATALYTNLIASPRIRAAESTLEGRKSIVIDFDSGAGLYSRDLEATFTWPLGLPTVLHVFQPSVLEQPEGIYSRAEDWDNGGTTGAKFIQGVIVDANSFNAAKTFQLQSGDDLSYHTLNECPATFNGQSEKAFSCAPFVAHSARIISSDGVEWQVFGSKLVFQPFPELTMNWETEKVSLGLTGWGHAREVNLAYISTAQITLVLSFDFWPSITLTIPGSAGLQLKTKITLPPNKFKLIGFRAYSTAGFRIFAEDIEVKVKQWGSTGPYVPIKPFGGPSSAGALV